MSRDPFADLQSALAVTPSPEFAAGVRARVAASKRPSPFDRPLFVLALAAAIVTAAVVTVRQVRERTHDTPAIEASAPLQATIRAIAPASMPVKPARKNPEVARHDAKATVRVADPFYEVLVPDDQRIALERLLASMKSGRTSVPRAATMTGVGEDGNLVITPLPDIVAVKIELLAGTPADAIKRENKKEP